MDTSAVARIYLADYEPPAYLVDAVELDFELDPAVTMVRSRLQLRRNPAAVGSRLPLILPGRQLELLDVALDGRTLTADQFELTDEALTVPSAGDQCELAIATRIHPDQNQSGLGMFVAGGVIATHFEADAFRKVTYFPDRPDVLSRYTVTLKAERTRYPVLLSNGNLVDHGELDGGRHYATWHDPFPKPSYIFALVAGDLERLSDTHRTPSGREVQLGIYAGRDRIGACSHAMQSLKRAMTWDEQVYGLEYDLDVYNIVALEGYVGAEENKGLNIFDVQTIVADPRLATDDDYMLIERIVAHEYFHNWSGNRVTCRDWFQLSLKEGLTRFRDLEFSRAMSASAEKRIEFVRRLRADQFAEDAGPGAHPVQPQSFIEVNNFYTTTVYDKGAEVIRMQHELLGRDAFLQGARLFFTRHDGQAVTTEEFLRCMEESGSVDLRQFRRWYTQAGTPELRVSGVFDAARRSYVLTVSQSCAATPGQLVKLPFHIPLAIGLLGGDGAELPLTLDGEAAGPTTRVLEIRQETESFTFVGLEAAPVPSLLRDFSAPVRVHIERPADDWAFLLAHDTDPFSRWDAGQQLMTGIMLELVAGFRLERALHLPAALTDAFGAVLRDRRDPALAAQLLRLPDEPVIGAAMASIDLDAIAAARDFLEVGLAQALRDEWLAAYMALALRGPYRPDAESIAARRLRNRCLAFMAALGERDALDLCAWQAERADNLTDSLAALAILTDIDCPQRTAALDGFYERWRDEDLVVNKWLFVQATSRLPGTAERVRQLMQHSSFDLADRAKGMALLGGFCRRNYRQFHDPSGAGYRLLGDVVLMVDAMRLEQSRWLMPQIMQWRRYDPVRRDLMCAELGRIAAAPGISRGLYEVVSNALAPEAVAGPAVQESTAPASLSTSSSISASEMM